MTINVTCPPPAPVFEPGTAGQQFVLAMTILIPLFVATYVFIFWYYQQTSLFLRKRSFPIVIFCACATMVTWAMTVLYDYLGSEHYPCWFFMLLVYLASPLFAAPGVVVLLRYANEVSALRLAQKVEMRSANGIEVNLDPEVSLETIRGHFRAVFLRSRVERDRILHAKFSRTDFALLFWATIFVFPFPLVYMIRLSTNSEWLECSGCQVGTFDGAFVLVTDVFAFGLVVSSNSFQVRKRDSLRLIREWLWIWSASIFWVIIAYTLYLTDPGGAYANGKFDWRFFLNFSCLSSLYVQTVHQILIARRLKRQLLQMPNINRSERFEDVRRDKELASRLRSFLDAELSSEILKFLDAVDNFRTNYDKEGTQQRAKKIFEDFIRLHSPFEVNISSELRYNLQAKLAYGLIEIHAFDDVYTLVKESLLVDGFARFLQKLAKDNVNFSSNNRLTIRVLA